MKQYAKVPKALDAAARRWLAATKQSRAISARDAARAMKASCLLDEVELLAAKLKMNNKRRAALAWDRAKSRTLKVPMRTCATYWDLIDGQWVLCIEAVKEPSNAQGV